MLLLCNLFLERGPVYLPQQGRRLPTRVWHRRRPRDVFGTTPEVHRGRALGVPACGGGPLPEGGSGTKLFEMQVRCSTNKILLQICIGCCGKPGRVVIISAWAAGQFKCWAILSRAWHPSSPLQAPITGIPAWSASYRTLHSRMLWLTPHDRPDVNSPD